MIKNLFLLGLLAWVSFTYAKHPVAQESMGDAEAFKVEKPTEEQEAQRSVAGEKIKKAKKWHPEGQEKVAPASATDSEVHYWKYSE